MNASRRQLPVMMIVSLALVGWAFQDTFASIVGVWRTNDTFSHGWLVVPISAWTAWRQSDRLAQTPWRPDWLGVPVCLFLAILWIASRGAGIRGTEQFAAVAMIPALFLAIMGRQAARAWAFPLGFLLFAVPVGHALVPGLMQVTADVATRALQVTGIPVVRSFMYISIPAGDFEVARACSGLNYLITGLVIGVLHAHLRYRGWRKRLVDVMAFVIIPVVANGLRVYITILVSHLTDMRYGPGEEHVWFGRVFFLCVLFLMFWIGSRWHDEPPRQRAPATVLRQAAQTSLLGMAPAVAAVAILLLAPASLRASTRAVEARLVDEVQDVALPQASAGWSGPLEDVSAWAPRYTGALAERRGSYVDSGGDRVDAYVAVYGIGVSGGSEMISYHNRLVAAENESLQQRRLRTVPAPGGEIHVVEQTVRSSGGTHRVWYWYQVGDRVAHDRFVVKGYEALAFLTHGAVTERIVTLSAPTDGRDEERLHAFVAAHVHCVGSGFSAEACGQ